jgi:hypothetical protein
MKKIILSFSLFIAGTAMVFANDDIKINEAVKQSFEKEFKGAQFIKWDQISEYSKAVFVLGGHRAEAYFSQTGELAYCVRDIFFDQLPLAVMTAVDKKFAKAGVAEVREISTTNGTEYRIIMEDQGAKYLIEADASGNINDQQKLKK